VLSFVDSAVFGPREVVMIPLIGLIVLLVFFVGKGTDGDNDYGPDPLA